MHALNQRSKPAKRTGREADPKRTLKLNGYAWQKVRASVLRDEPLCRHCTARGLVVPATDVDHMNGSDDNRRASLQPLCHECHSRKTAQDRGKRVACGHDASGHPADPTHFWNRPL
jgi:5-methylcytosine-specific restriction protein A